MRETPGVPPHPVKHACGHAHSNAVRNLGPLPALWADGGHSYLIICGPMQLHSTDKMIRLTGCIDHLHKPRAVATHCERAPARTRTRLEHWEASTLSTLTVFHAQPDESPTCWSSAHILCGNHGSVQSQKKAQQKQSTSVATYILFGGIPHSGVLLRHLEAKLRLPASEVK